MSEKRLLKPEAVQEVHLETDILIIGAGNAGCFAAIEAKRLNPNLKVTLLEKAHIDRSGCLAAGMDALNTYIKKGKTREDLVRWSRDQVGGGPLREDLTLSMAEYLNRCIEEWEEWGLPIKKDENGEYLARGKWDIAIHGESMKVILAEKVREYNCEVINKVAATSYLVDEGRVVGVTGLGVKDGKFYVVRAGATIVATGGAAGLYKPYTNDGNDCHHQIWYSPFNVGTGYAMGIRIGAEMTSFEMRWCAVRTKDFNGPIDTISVGYNAAMINGRGEKILQTHYSHLGGEAAPRFIRANAPMDEWLAGRGPTYVDTTGMTPEQVKDLKEDYLNERPTFVQFLAARGQDITREPIEVYGSDPYIVGGHTASGYWINNDRSTTVPGLFACGDVAGGVPNKFVGGCAAEGVLAAIGAVQYVAGLTDRGHIDPEPVKSEKERVYAPMVQMAEVGDGITPREMEERLQRLMDEYAGGVHQFYRTDHHRLEYALKHIKILQEQVRYLIAEDVFNLLAAHEVIDRLTVAEVLVHHLLYRAETRWPGWQTRADFPEKDEKLNCFVNSRFNPETGAIEVFTRPYEKVVD